MKKRTYNSESVAAAPVRRRFPIIQYLAAFLFVRMLVKQGRKGSMVLALMLFRYFFE